MIQRWRKHHPDGESPASRLVRRLDALREVHPGTMRDARELLGELWRLPAERRIDATLALARRWNRRLLVLATLDRVRRCFPSKLHRVEEEIEVAHALVMSLDASTPQGPSWRVSAHVRLLTYRTLHLAVTGRVLEASRVALLQLGDTEALRDEVAAITPILAVEDLQHEPAAGQALPVDASGLELGDQIRRQVLEIPEPIRFQVDLGEGECNESCLVDAV